MQKSFTLQTFALFLALQFFFQKAVCQVINTDDGFTAEELIKDIFIGGNCFDVTRITPIGDSRGRGAFDSGGGSIGMEEGIVLSSGFIRNIPGPNNSSGSSSSFSGGAGADPDLSILAGNSIFDVVGIEFDFIPTTGFVQFDYVFGSEEYCEFVGAAVNDVFGFFISGPGISGPYSNGGMNLAIIPLTTDPISVNTVNDMVNSNFYVDNVRISPTPPPPTSPCFIGGSNPPAAANEIQFDGFTTVLSAFATVIPCEKYTIRLVVADVLDGLLDAGVFLKSNSFAGDGLATVEVTSTLAAQDDAFEACEEACFIFSRGISDLSDDIVIAFDIDAASTATEGVDFSNLPRTITIPAGDPDVKLPVNIISDALVEGQETIILNLDNSCNCSASFTILTIKDSDPFSVTLDDESICSGESVSLSPNVIGGVAPLQYDWDSGDTGASIQVSPNATTTYTVTVTDDCGEEEIVSATVTVTPAPHAEVSGYFEDCGPNIDELVPVIFTQGDPPFDFSYSINGGTPITVSGIAASPYQLRITQYGIYQLTFVGSNGCVGTVSGQVEAVEIKIESDELVENITCHGANDGLIDAGTPTGGSNPYIFNWAHTSSNLPTQGTLPPGNYPLTITDGHGCELIKNLRVVEPPPLQPVFLNVEDINCFNFGGIIEVDASGGTPDFSFQWSNGETSPDMSNLPPGTYYLTVTDINNCEAIDSATIVQNDDFPIVNILPPDTLDCATGSVFLDGSGSSDNPNGDLFYSWLDDYLVDFAYDDTVTVFQPGAYTLVIENLDNGCITEETVFVEDTGDRLQVNLSASGNLSCKNIQSVLAIDTTSFSNTTSYIWYNSAGDSLGNAPNLAVSQSGNYTVSVTDSATGCFDEKTLAIGGNFSAPDSEAGLPQTLSCTAQNVLLNAAGSTTAAHVLHFWLNAAGDTLGFDLTQNVNDVGTYTFVNLDTISGCSTQDTVSVLADQSFPAAVPDIPEVLNCNRISVALSGDTQSSGSLSFQWMDSAGNVLSNNQQAVANQPGAYFFIVENSSNGCADTALVNVRIDTLTPAFSIANPPVISCDSGTVELIGMLGNSSADFEYSWRNSAGDLLGDSLNLIVNQAGFYSLFIKNKNTGCFNEKTVEVKRNTAVPILDAGNPDILSCSDLNATLIGSGSATDVDYFWLNENGDTLGHNLTQNVSSVGIYTLLGVHQISGCSSVDTVSVRADTNFPVAIPGQNDTITCDAQTIQLTGQTLSGSNFIYSWNDAAGTSISNLPTTTVANSGIYFFVVENTQNGCADTASIEIFADTLRPQTAILPPGMLTCRDSVLNLTGSVTSSGSNAEVFWTDALGNQLDSGLNLTIIQPGTYSFFVKNNENNCQNKKSVTILSDFREPMPDAGNPGFLSCSGTGAILDGSGSSTADTDYFWLNPSGDTISQNLTETVSSVGIYSLVGIHRTSGCRGEDTVSVKADLNFPVAIPGQNDTINCDARTIQLSGQPLSGSNFIYTWSDAGGTPISNVPTATINQPGIYFFEVENTQNGCADTAFVEIFADTLTPQAAIIPPGVLNCRDSVLNLSASIISGGTNTEIYWADAADIPLATGLDLTVNQPGSYSFFIKNNTNQCSEKKTITILSDLAEPSIEAGNQQEISCTDQSVILNGIDAATDPDTDYFWLNTDGDTIENLVSVTVSTTGLFTLHGVNNRTGCTHFDTVSVIADRNFPVALPGKNDTLNCEQSSIQLIGDSGNPGNLSFVWKNATGDQISNAQSAVITEPGIYFLEVENLDNGCADTASVEILSDTLAPVAVLPAADTLTCNIQSVNLLANTSGNFSNPEIIWTDAANVPVGFDFQVAVTEPGIYSFFIKNQTNGCFDQKEITVFENIEKPVPDIDSPIRMLACDVPFISADGSNSLPVGNLNFEWTTDNGNILSDPGLPEIEIGEAGNYLLKITDLKNGCFDSLDLEITADLDTPTVFIANPEKLTCDVKTVDLNVSTDISNPNFSWTAVGSGTIFSGSTGQNPTINEPGIYMVEILNSDNGCSGFNTIEVEIDTISPTAIAAASNILTCDVKTISLDGTGSSSGSIFEYLWSSDQNSSGIAGETTLSPDVDASDFYTLLVRNSENGCIETARVFVEQDTTPPVAEAAVFEELNCMLKELNLSGQGSSSGNDFTYSWSGSGIISGQTSLEPRVNAPGDYEINVLDNRNGCVAVKSVTVRENTNVPTDFDLDILSPSCKISLGEIFVEGVIGGTGDYTYSLDGINFGSATVFGSLAPGNYTVFVRDSIGCEYQEQIILEEPAEPEISLDPEVISIQIGDDNQLFPQLNISPDEVDSVFWTPADFLSCSDCLNPIASPHHSIEYTVTVISDDECVDKASVTFRVATQPDVYIPSAFSPSNNDGINDKITVFGSDKNIEKVNIFQIYSRWGELLFTAQNFQPNDPDLGWDGTYRGKKMNSGVFVYFAEVEFINGNRKIFKGDVTLVR